MDFRLDVPALRLTVFRIGDPGKQTTTAATPESIGATLSREWKRTGSVQSALFTMREVTLAQVRSLLAGPSVLDVVFADQQMRVNKVVQTEHQNGLSERVQSRRITLASKRTPRPLLPVSRLSAGKTARPRRRHRTKKKSASWLGFLSY